MRPIFNLPNRITLARLLGSIGLFVILASMPGPGDDRRPLAWLAFGVFTLTAATDWLDGYLARKLSLETVFGRIMDPFVDKVVVCGAFIFLLDLKPAADYLQAWMVVAIVAREFFVSSIRGYIESRGVSFAAERSGKLKMVIQCFAVGTLLFILALESVPEWIDVVATVAVWAALLSTAQSGGVYLLKAIRALEGGLT